MPAKLIPSVNGVLLNEYTLDSNLVTIGRGADNDIQIDSQAVSKHHAAITTVQSEVLLEDLHSLNGTFVNGKLTMKHMLKSGDVITIEDYELKYVTEELPALQSKAFESLPVITKEVQLITRSRLRESGGDKVDVGLLVDSYAFWDVVRLWARERLVHEVLIARELACGVVDEGLRFQSVNPKFVKSSETLRREPLVGYAWKHQRLPVLLRSEAFSHLEKVMLEVVEPSFDSLRHEFVFKHDFQDWLVHTGRQMPAFWYSQEERFVEA